MPGDDRNPKKELGGPADVRSEPLSPPAGTKYLGRAAEPIAAPAVKPTTGHMTRAFDCEPAIPDYRPVAARSFPPEEEARVCDALKRCSPSTREAAREFRKTGNAACIAAIVDGLIEHYVDPDVRAKLASGDDRLRLSEDLEIDSLTMLEIVYLAEDVLQISVDNEDIRPFRTVGDIKAFLASKLGGASPPVLALRGGSPA
jgi:acyl carrier protein